MVKIPAWKAYLIVFICVVGLVYAFPNLLGQKNAQNLPSWLPNETINLGLDLQGGSHLLLQVDVNSVLAEHLNNMTDTLRRVLRSKKVPYRNYAMSDNTVRFRVDPENVPLTREVIEEELGTDVTITSTDEGRISVSLSEIFIKDRKDYALQQSIEIVRRRVDETGTKEPVIQRQGEDRIVLQLPGIDDPERIKGLLGRTAKLTFHLVDLESMDSSTKKRIPVSSIRIPSSRSEVQSGGLTDYILKRRAILTGDMLVDASPSFQDGRPVVSFRLDNRGAKRFADVTTENVGKPFAIVLDGEVISAPRIQSPILGGNAVITGSFSTEEVQDMALLLRAGALPAPLNILEERTVGPGLGADSIEAGKIASMVGLLAVIGFIILTYGMYGVMAVLALIINITLIIAALSAFQATLTLPGIAGIVLTIGMAVDANVLIFERIREETSSGRSPISAVDAGYSNAYSSIVDANITTLIAALLLYIFGTGPIRGFAVTLSIGIVTSFFSAIMVTRLMLTTWLWRVKPQMIRI